MGLDVLVSPVLPLHPSPGEDARRMVRHGLADVLAWLGQPVGPQPGAQTHVLRVGTQLHVSREAWDRLRSECALSP